MKIIRPTMIEQGDFESTAPADGFSIWEPLGRDFLTGLDIEAVGATDGFGYFAENTTDNTLLYKVDLATGDISQIDVSINRIEQVIPSHNGLYFAVLGRGTGPIGTTGPVLRVIRNSDGIELFLTSAPAMGRLYTQWSHDDGFLLSTGDGRLQVINTSTWNSAITIDTYRTITQAATSMNEDWSEVFFGPQSIAAHGAADYCSVIYRAVYGNYPVFNYRWILATINLSTGAYATRVLSSSASTDFLYLIHNSARSELLLFSAASPQAVNDQTLVDVSPSPALPVCIEAAIDSSASEIVFRASSVTPKFRRISAVDYTDAGSLDSILPSEGRSVVYDSAYYVATLESGGYALIDRTNDTLETETNPSVTAGDVYTYQNSNYEALADNNDRPDQGAVADPPTWVDLGAINPLRMFDGSISSVTTSPEILTVSVKTSSVTKAVGLFAVQASTVRIQLLDQNDVEQFDTGELELVDNTDIQDLSDYFFNGVTLTPDFVYTLLPPYLNATVVVTLTPINGQVSVGEMVVGDVQSLGDALFGTSVGILDFSRKERDQFGNFQIVERNFSKRANYSVSVPTRFVSSVQQKLAEYRSTPVVFIGSEENPETVVYGFYRSFDIVLEGPTVSSCSIEVEGLT